MSVTGDADRARWAKPESYQASWDSRAVLAASLVPDGAQVFEVGVGRGKFRSLVRGRCSYFGADLEPLDAETQRLDLDLEELPSAGFDIVVALGVLEYLSDPGGAIGRLCRAGRSVLISYCLPVEGMPASDAAAIRSKRGWRNCLDQSLLVARFAHYGKCASKEVLYNETSDFKQSIFLFSDAERRPLRRRLLKLL